jgi:tRNA:m4X modification enzyme
MCGAALDISVRGLMKTKMSGCVLASCCHHLCSYDTYLNNEYFEAEGWTGQDIQIMFKMSSWGTRKTWVEPGINLQELK